MEASIMCNDPKKHSVHAPFHCHPSSIDSGSNVDRMVEQSKVLGSGYSVITDHGFMGDCLKHYHSCKKAGIKPILGLEGYFKDNNCPIIKGTESESLKYFHFTVHFKDQKAYQAACRILSDCDRHKAISAGGERKPIFEWSDLEELATYNITMGSGCLIGMVSRHILVGREDLAEAYYVKLRNLVGPDDFFVELSPHICDHYWQNNVKITLANGEQIKVWDGAKFDTKAAKGVTALQIASAPARYNFIETRYIRRSPIPINQEVSKVEKIKGFIKQEEGDIQLVANKFCLKMAKKYGDRCVISDDAHYAIPEDKVVQNSLLGENFRFYGDYSLLKTSEVLRYYKESLEMSDQEIDDMIENSHIWASKFDNFELKYEYRLPTPEDDPMKLIMKSIKELGRFDSSNPEAVRRLRWELDVFTNNGVVNILPYFFPIQKVLDHYKKNNELVGPGRGCLSGESLVYSNNILAKLKDLKEGDRVFTHDGSIQRILEVFKYPTQEKLLSISSQYSFGDLSLTKDHKLLGIKREETQKYLTASNRSKNKFRRWEQYSDKDKKWDRADSFKEGDFLFTPWLKREIKEFPKIDMWEYCKKYRSVLDGNDILLQIPKNNEFAIRQIHKITGLSKNCLSSIKKNKNIERAYPKTINKLSHYLSQYNYTIGQWIDDPNLEVYRIKRFLIFDESTCRTIGRWIGDGWISSNKNSNGSSNFGIAFNRNEVTKKEHFTNWLNSYGLKYSIQEHKAKQLTQITCRWGFIRDIFKDLFPNYSYSSNTKYIDKFLYLEDRLLKELLIGLIESDGSISSKKYKTGIDSRVSYDTTSFRLASEMKLLLNFLKIPSGIVTRKPNNRGQYKCKESYKLRFFNPDKQRTSKENLITEEGYYSKILKISEIDGDGYVFDIKVENNHNYLTSNFIVHNSAGGSYLCYLIGITQLDPLKYNLPFERFFSIDRIKNKDLPDIDVDLPHRRLLVGEDGNSGILYDTWGEKAAQISTRILLRLKSSIIDANRFVNKGEVEEEIEEFAKQIKPPPQGISDQDYVFGYVSEDGHGARVPGLLEISEDLQKYAIKRPREWEIVKRSLGVSRQNSRHASAFCISDIPIKEIVPTFTVGDTPNVTQYDAKMVEKAGLIKYDFLCVSSLQDIGDCLKAINKKNGDDFTIGTFKHNGQETYIWDLPSDIGTNKMIGSGKAETVFQINTNSMAPFIKRIKPKSIVDLATILALVRPGPMDFIDPITGRSMAEEYMWRREGRSKGEIEVLNQMIPDTYGILCFQEDLTLIAKKMAGFDPQKAETLRKHMCKKNMRPLEAMKPDFISGSLSNGYSQHDVETVWEMMVKFGQYGFSCIAGDQLIQTSSGLKRMDEVINGDFYVAYLDQNKKIRYEKPSHGQLMGEKEVFEIELEDGTFIKCTEDHKFLTDGNWKTAKEIIKDQKIEVIKIKKKKGIENHKIAKCWCGHKVTTNTLKIHLNSKNCKLNSTDKEHLYKSLDLLKKHRLVWLKSEGENAVALKHPIKNILEKTLVLDDLITKSPRPQNFVTPNKIKEYKEKRKGLGNPSVKKRLKNYNEKLLIEFVCNLYLKIQSESILPKGGLIGFIKEKTEIQFPDWGFQFQGNFSHNMKNKCNFLIKKWLTDNGYDWRALQIKIRGRLISKGQKSSKKCRMSASLMGIQNSKKKTTRPQLRLFDLIKAIDPKATLEYKIKGERTYKSYDIYSPKIDTLIEMNGVTWHSLEKTTHKYKSVVEKNIENDKYKEQLAKERGYKISVFWDDAELLWPNQIKELYANS
jgi:DNA polymerase III alpha subunit/intein/homing endonuclease